MSNQVLDLQEETNAMNVTISRDVPVDKKYVDLTVEGALIKLSVEVEMYRHATEGWTAKDFITDQGIDLSHKGTRFYYGNIIDEVLFDKFRVHPMMNNNDKNIHDYLDKKLNKNKNHVLIIIKGKTTDLSICGDSIFGGVNKELKPVQFTRGSGWENGTLNDFNGNHYVFFEVSKKLQESFDNANADYYKMKELENSRKILDDAHIPNWAAIPFKRDDHSYVIRANESHYFAKNLDERKKNFDKVKETLEANVMNVETNLHESSVIAKNLEKLDSVDNDPVFDNWVQEELKKHKLSVDRLSHSLADAKNRLNNHVNVDYGRERKYAATLDCDENICPLADALEKRANVLGVRFDRDAWVDLVDDKLDIFALHRVYV